MQTPSPFAGREFLTRNRIETLIGRKDPSWWDYLEGSFDKRTLADAGVKDLAAFAKWYPTVREVLAPDEEGLLHVDADLKAAAIDASRPEFFERCIAALDRPGEAMRPSRRLLVRYAPEGPGARLLPLPGPAGGRPIAITCSSVRSAVTAGISIPWRRNVACPPPAFAAPRGPAGNSCPAPQVMAEMAGTVMGCGCRLLLAVLVMVRLSGSAAGQTETGPPLVVPDGFVVERAARGAAVAVSDVRDVR